MSDLQTSDFRQFFIELHEKEPFPWQEALAERVCMDNWPRVIDLPTASGKTACIDIALFAMALRGFAVPRRIFFVVDRRVVVNEAYLRMQKICAKLCEAKTGVLGTVARLLQELAGDEKPLGVYEMRGGAFRDETWVRNPQQPTVVASTVDQVGSRLLFRGYGVSDYSWPLHAGLIGNDALIILDEAHCSRAFAQTLRLIERYRSDSWADDPIRTPFRFVEMTATPSQEKEEHFRITDADRTDKTLERRLYAPKPTHLIEVKAKSGDFTKLADELISQAMELAKTAEAKRVAILVNRVRTAKIVYERLRKHVSDAHVELVIGRMRQIDRDDLYEKKLANLKSGTPRKISDPLTYVVSTQCLEVGADLDFDVLVSDCASIDALLQRFGRLDRLGDFGRAQGAIVISSWQANPNHPDPIYGEAIFKTWEWLKQVGGQNENLNMGIESIDGQVPTVPQLLQANHSKDMKLHSEDAPILLPAHLDALVQTSPVPAPDPSIELFLHGVDRSIPDIYVVWRADLDADAFGEEWIEIVKLCPPSSPEIMPVPINTFQKWFAGQKNADGDESDLPIGTKEGDEPKQERKARALVWQGDDSKEIKNASEVKPGQTIILPASAEGWNDLGYIPNNAAIDVGDRAAFNVRRSVTLRLHPEIMREWQQTPVLDSVKSYALQDGAEWSELKERLKQYRKELEANGDKAWPYAFLEQLLDASDLSPYPNEKFPYFFEARKIGPSLQLHSERVLLKDHLEHVETKVEEIAAKVHDKFRQPLRIAAKFHDYGKVDVRYQAWLLGGDLMAAQYAPKPFAKSGRDLVRKQDTVGLPRDFRHELLSLIFAEKSTDVQGDARDLILHLVASHHGRCRPFATVILDERADCASYAGISVCKQERIEKAPHRLDSDVADRFWRLTRKYGWWGIAYLEALLRLADWNASENENSEGPEWAMEYCFVRLMDPILWRFSQRLEHYDCYI